MSAADVQEGDIRWLQVDDLVLLNQKAIEYYTPNSPALVKNQGALESSQARPSQFRYYTQTNDLLVLGAVLYTSIIWNHPFHDGNKRTAHLACRAFLLINGAEFLPPIDEAVEMAVGVAEHECDEYQLADWISRYAQPIDCADHLLTGDGGQDLATGS